LFFSVVVVITLAYDALCWELQLQITVSNLENN
jgi:hypothetical protein